MPGRRCGELFSAGLESYRSNYRIAKRLADDETQEILRDRVWLNSPSAITGGEIEQVFPFAVELVRHQERMLSDALHLDQLGDYEALHKGFETFLRLSRWDWDSRDGASFSDELEQFYRVALIGLSGRVIILAESKKIEEPSGFLAVARVICGGVARLAADVAQAFSYQDQSQATLWSEWEWEGAEPGIVRTLSSERYPLTFFAVRLMELSSDDMPLIDLHGTASQALSWFELNADRLLPFVSDQPGAPGSNAGTWP